MKVSDVMTKRVLSATPDMALKDVAAKMLEYGISGMPVVDGDRVLGVISETDVLFKERSAPRRHGLVDWLVHYGEDPPRAKLEARTAAEAMTAPAVTIAPNRSVADAAELMLELRIDRLPVVEGEQLTGIVTRADLVRAFTRTDGEIEDEIREDVILKTLWTSPDAVTVSVKDGDVVLEGSVEAESLGELIPWFASRVPGVVSIDSRLTWPETTNDRPLEGTWA